MTLTSSPDVHRQPTGKPNRAGAVGAIAVTVGISGGIIGGIIVGIDAANIAGDLTIAIAIAVAALVWVGAVAVLAGGRPLRVRRPRLGSGVLMMLVAAMAVVTPVAPAAAENTPGPVPNSNQSWAPPGSAGWTRTFLDSFTTPINTAIWGRYQGKSSSSTLSTWSPSNVYTQPYTGSGGEGHLLINTVNTDGVWTSGGLSSGRGVTRVQGQWLIRAKFDRAPGIGYVFLLYPQGGVWPPEVDFVEGSAGTTTVMATLHYDADNKTISKKLYDFDITKWHTYGVIMYGDTLSYTIDGAVWYSIAHQAIPAIPMWIGMQANAKPNNGKNVEWVTSATPDSSKIDIDWVAHYSYSG